MRDPTEKIIAQAEEFSGYPVHVKAQESLSTPSTVKFPRGSLDACLVLYDPQRASEPDYMIAYQCGFIIRFFRRPPDERRYFGAAETGRQETEKLIGQTKLGKTKPELVDGLAERLFEGLMTQLSSAPIGLRVDKWIRRDYPSLHELQEAEVRREQKENLEVLGESTRKMFPEKIYRGNIAINAAQAEFWSQVLQEPPLRSPYKGSRYYKKGMKLLNAWADIPDDPAEDRQLVDTWAKELGVADWYRWIPFEEMQES